MERELCSDNLYHWPTAASSNERRHRHPWKEGEVISNVWNEMRKGNRKKGKKGEGWMEGNNARYSTNGECI